MKEERMLVKVEVDVRIDTENEEKAKAIAPTIVARSIQLAAGIYQREVVELAVSGKEGSAEEKQLQTIVDLLGEMQRSVRTVGVERGEGGVG